MNCTHSHAVRTAAPCNNTAQARAAPVRREGFGEVGRARRSGNRSGRWRTSAPVRARRQRPQTPAPWRAARHPHSKRHRHCISRLPCRLRDGDRLLSGGHRGRPDGNDDVPRALQEELPTTRPSPPFDRGWRRSSTSSQPRSPAMAVQAATATSARCGIGTASSQFRRCGNVPCHECPFSGAQPPPRHRARCPATRWSGCRRRRLRSALR